MNLIEQKPPYKTHFKDYIITKITAYHEKQLRMDSIKNSKMTYFNVNVKGLNGRVHPALSGIISTRGVQNQELMSKCYAVTCTHTNSNLNIKEDHHSVNYV